MVYIPSMKHIKESIKEVIDKEGVTRYRIAKDLGMDESNLHYLLKEGSNPEWSTVEKLIGYLGYDYKLFKRKEVKGVRKSSRKPTKGR